MSDPTRRLPARPSLEQLRKQAKERHQAARAADPGATLAGAQHTLAREYGFDSWPKLVHYIESLQSSERLDLFERLAQDMLAGYAGDPAALERLGAYFGDSYNNEQRLERVRDRIHALHGRSAVPTEPRPPLTDRDWDAILGVMADRRITGIATPAMTDRALQRLLRLDFVSRIRIDGARQVSDDGLLHLARMHSLEKLEFWETAGITNAGIAALARLPNLREITVDAPNVTRAGMAVFPAAVRVRS